MEALFFEPQYHYDPLLNDARGVTKLGEIMDMRFILDDKISIVVDTQTKEAILGYNKVGDKQIRLSPQALKKLKKVLEEVID